VLRGCEACSCFGMEDNEQMSEQSPAEGCAMSEGEEMYAEDLTDEEDDNDDDLDDEDDSDDVLEDLMDGPLGRVDMDGSDSDIEYGRGGYYYPFGHDLILNGQQKERYGSGKSYELKLPRPGPANSWVHLFSAALSGNTDAVQRELRCIPDFGDSVSQVPQHVDFFVVCTPAACRELKLNIGHHLCDRQYALHTPCVFVLPHMVLGT
jgi:hypothetical protein